MLGGARGKLYVMQGDKTALRSGASAPEPLVLHAAVGDCLLVHLRNETAASISFHADLLAPDPGNPRVVLPEETRSYSYYAHPEVGETVALVTDRGNFPEDAGLGLYGAIIVAPRGSRHTHPLTGEDMALKSGWRVDVHPPSGPSYRDFALFLQDQDEVIGTALMPYTEQVKGPLGVNYRVAPLRTRSQPGGPPSESVSASAIRDPATPILEAFVGDAVRIHVLVPFGEQSHVFSLEGHEWPLEPGRARTPMLSSIKVGGLEGITLIPARGAGGEAGLGGAYLYGDHREPYREAGLWGIFRVYGDGATGVNLIPLPGVPRSDLAPRVLRVPSVTP
jgi:hypothetical protein